MRRNEGDCLIAGNHQKSESKSSVGMAALKCGNSAWNVGWRESPLCYQTQPSSMAG